MKRDEYVLIRVRDPYGGCPECWLDDYENQYIVLASQADECIADLMERRPYVERKEIDIERIENWGRK